MLSPISTHFLHHFSHQNKPKQCLQPSMVLVKLAPEWLIYQLLANSYKAAMKLKPYVFILFKTNTQLLKSQPLHQFPNITHCCLQGRSSQTLVCDINATLISSHHHQSFFPYFMLVAFEAGSILRAFLLLLSYPFISFLPFQTKLRLMIFLTFFGLKVNNMESIGRAVLPKFYLEDMNFNVYEVLRSSGSKVIITSVPRVMVEGFLTEYLDVDFVRGTELHTIFGNNYFSGLVSSHGVLSKQKALREFLGDDNKTADIGIGNFGHLDRPFLSMCKEAYVVQKEDGRNNGIAKMPREKYPKPLVFHDGRLAFFPTPLSTLIMFVWLPTGVILSIFRLMVGILLPYNIAMFLGCLSGVKITLKGSDPKRSENGKGFLYVCSHRTLLDPVFLSTCLKKPLTAVTYSLSKVSEIIAPIRTVRLTRDRAQDSSTMEKLLGEGDLVVCPEGTTCREPYLLRFSSLFAELADEIVPVAMDTRVSMFYGTTASGLKFLDPIFFLMNPRPTYCVHILGKLPFQLTCAGGKSSHEVANYIQRQLGDALGFECTTLTRKDKYLMLAGNEGVVPPAG